MTLLTYKEVFHVEPEEKKDQQEIIDEPVEKKDPTPAPEPSSEDIESREDEVMKKLDTIIAGIEALNHLAENPAVIDDEIADNDDVGDDGLSAEDVEDYLGIKD